MSEIKEDGLGMTSRPTRMHQRVCRDMMLYLMDVVDESYEVLMDANLDDDNPASLAPDIMVEEIETEKVLVVVEVSRKAGVKSDVRKVQNLIKENLYDIIEGFVYDYENDEFLRIDKDGITQTSFSTVLSCEISKFLPDGEE